LAGNGDDAGRHDHGKVGRMHAGNPREIGGHWSRPCRYQSRPRFSPKQPRLARAAGQSRLSWPARAAFIVAVSSHNCITTRISTTHRMPVTIIPRSWREKGLGFIRRTPRHRRRRSTRSELRVECAATGGAEALPAPRLSPGRSIPHDTGSAAFPPPPPAGPDIADACTGWRMPQVLHLADAPAGKGHSPSDSERSPPPPPADHAEW